jgi:hypothetical protein
VERAHQVVLQLGNYASGHGFLRRGALQGDRDSLKIPLLFFSFGFDNFNLR